MSFKVSEEAIELTYTEQAFSEIPNLLFGTATDGTHYFDATYYLLQKKDSKTIYDFWEEYASPIRTLLSSNSISDNKAFCLNKDGHVLVVFDLVYLFLSFVEPNFLSYVCDRMNDLFSDGFCVSDTYLLRSYSERLSDELLIHIINERQSKKE